MPTIRHPAVAGLFYPDDPKRLEQALDACFQGAARTSGTPKALIVPHAGYVYSGPVAASAYRLLPPLRGKIRRVVLLGPSHRVAFRGLAASGAAYFETPLGRVPADPEAAAVLTRFPQVALLDRAHAAEHSLEVHLPFLKRTLGDFVLVPLVVGEACAEDVRAVLEALWGGDETLVVISTDLSHYHDSETARALDARTAQAIEASRYDELSPEDACGAHPLCGLLKEAARRGLKPKRLDLRNSSDTAGPRDNVVGYGAWLIEEGGKT